MPQGVISSEYRAGGSGDEITIKKTAILLIETPIFHQNMGKTGLLKSYDQEICSFIDRNPGRDVKVRPRGARRNPEKDTGRDAERYRKVSRGM